VPCCVDEHGATPVPENDSHGEFIYAIAEYYRHTGDKAELEKMWPHVVKAVAYMDSLRHLRMTEQYTVGANKAFYGLLPESISHEGYSAKPVHSYWDDFFALKGLEDAGWKTTMRENLAASIRRTIAKKKIDYIPGAAELGDFDPSATAIAISPLGLSSLLPERELAHTFDRYL